MPSSIRGACAGALLATAGLLLAATSCAAAEAGGYSLFDPAPSGKLRDLCPDRPGVGSPPCTVDAGHFQLEVGLFDAQHDRTADAVTDTDTFGDLQLRLGLTDRLEAQLSVSPWITVRRRDRMTGARDEQRGTGDVTLALKHSFGDPDGISWALQPFVTAPTGSRDIGGDAWQGGLLAPVAFSLSGGLGLALTTEVDVAPDADGSGRHLAYSEVVGLGHAIGPAAATVELWSSVDDDPGGQTTQAGLALSASWVPSAMPDTQFDIGGDLGLNRETPDSELYVGVAHRF